MTKYVVQFSGGVGSWAAAQRLVDAHGPQSVDLLFADTLMEDEDLYRFMAEAVESLDARFIKIQDGRDPWGVFNDVRFLGNTRADPCSRVLKRDLLWSYMRANYDPTDSVICFGIDFTEEHRLRNVQKRNPDWVISAPMCEPPYKSKQAMLEDLAAVGIKPPRLYKLGFPHNNCGGFCVKAGQAHFELLLRTMPERYAYHENKEQEIRALLGNVSILRDRTGGNTRPMTLAEFRLRIESQPSLFDRYEWGGCGCALGE